jgi:hypothetical protein
MKKKNQPPPRTNKHQNAHNNTHITFTQIWDVGFSKHFLRFLMVFYIKSSIIETTSPVLIPHEYIKSPHYVDNKTEPKHNHSYLESEKTKRKREQYKIRINNTFREKAIKK